MKSTEAFERKLTVAVLPHDTYGRDWGLLIDKKLPAVLGSNIAGVIENVGPGVTWKLGERIFGISSADPISSDQAGLQEYAILNTNAIGKIPEGFLDEQVVTLPINLVTSWTALFAKSGFDIPPSFAHQQSFDYAGTSLLIIGGGTNVGQLAVQLARIAGIGTIIVIAGASNRSRLMSMGATHVIDRHSSLTDISQQIQTIVGPDGLTSVYLCAQMQVDLAIAALATSRTSRLRALLPIEEEDALKLRMCRPLCDASFIDDLTNESMAPHTEQFWAAVPQWLMDKKVLPTKYEVIEGLEKVKEINEALDSYRDLARVGPQVVVKI